ADRPRLSWDSFVRTRRNLVSLAAKRPKGGRSRGHCQIFAGAGQGGRGDGGSAPTRDNSKVDSGRSLERGSQKTDARDFALRAHASVLGYAFVADCLFIQALIIERAVASASWRVLSSGNPLPGA